jgi:hypothetical protein
MKLITGNDRAIAAYSRACKWTPLGLGRYADEHGSAVRRLFQPEGLWGMTPTKLPVLMPDNKDGAALPMSQTVRAILAEAEKRRMPVEQIKVAA